MAEKVSTKKKERPEPEISYKVHGIRYESCEDLPEWVRQQVADALSSVLAG